MDGRDVTSLVVNRRNCGWKLDRFFGLEGFLVLFYFACFFFFFFFAFFYFSFLSLFFSLLLFNEMEAAIWCWQFTQVYRARSLISHLFFVVVSRFASEIDAKIQVHQKPAKTKSMQIPAKYDAKVSY